MINPSGRFSLECCFDKEGVKKHVYNAFELSIGLLQADVEISFKISDFEKAEVFDESWSNPQLLCSQKGASVKGGLGPFGLMVLASKGMEEYTAVFFRIFKRQTKYVVLMCSDQSRSSIPLSVSL